ncbi:hypothetical protein RR48_05159 [Papilio machaon]|uniref:Uncharacterized protein n=1 Tax=Papilio machaon TaxID=76193 RepID=A0A0N0PC45_PAPMA|nr:hypothetical protein RR48_05159 [Papilio machaon]
MVRTPRTVLDSTRLRRNHRVRRPADNWMTCGRGALDAAARAPCGGCGGRTPGGVSPGGVAIGYAARSALRNSKSTGRSAVDG